MTDHSITPPPELIEDWIEIAKPEPWKRPPDPNVLCTLAAQWGSDQELEACCHYFARDLRESLALELRAARRPKPPSLKEQALGQLTQLVADLDRAGMRKQAATLEGSIRRALEQLDD